MATEAEKTEARIKRKDTEIARLMGDIKKLRSRANTEATDHSAAKESKVALERDLKSNKVRLADLKEAVQDREGRGRRVAVDWGGGLIGFVLFEGLNAAIRAGGSALNLSDGWIAYLQGVPHLVIGNIVYGIELATRDTKNPVTMRREVISEAAKDFAEYGLSTTFRAFRAGSADKKQATADMAAEIARKNAQIQALQQQLQANK